MASNGDNSGHRVTASSHFYEELNDFLAPARRKRKQKFSVPCARAAATKHMIEALGVPHTEVEWILVNGESTDFNRQLEDGDRVAVYPRLYWEGSHWRNMRRLLDGVLPNEDAGGTE